MKMKLIKPFELAKEDLPHIVFLGTKEANNSKSIKSDRWCCLRDKIDPSDIYDFTFGKCMTTPCEKCFYQASNKLNVLKYRKKILNESI